MKTEITHEEFVQLEGLLALARGHVKDLVEIERAALALTGENQGGHTSDFVWSQEGGARLLCEKLKIAVRYPEHPEHKADHFEVKGGQE